MPIEWIWYQIFIIYVTDNSRCESSLVTNAQKDKPSYLRCYCHRAKKTGAPATIFSRVRSLAGSVWRAMCLHVRLLCGALWWPLLMRCARAARTYDDDYEQVRHRRSFLSVHFAFAKSSFVCCIHSLGFWQSLRPAFTDGGSHAFFHLFCFIIFHLFISVVGF